MKKTKSRIWAIAIAAIMVMTSFAVLQVNNTAQAMGGVMVTKNSKWYINKEKTYISVQCKLNANVPKNKKNGKYITPSVKIIVKYTNGNSYSFYRTGTSLHKKGNTQTFKTSCKSKKGTPSQVKCILAKKKHGAPIYESMWTTISHKK